jgi:hypothetical protein
MSGHRLHLYQDIVYIFWYDLSPKKGENYDLEGNNNDGAENRVYNRVAIRKLYNHRALQTIFNLKVPPYGFFSRGRFERVASLKIPGKSDPQESIPCSDEL